MPNWCENKLVVSGEAEDIKKFRKLSTPKKGSDVTGDLSLGKLYPEPDYTKIKVKHAFPDIGKKESKYADTSHAWWDWRVQNWGTKWEVDATLDCEEEDLLEYFFNSAWSPPVEWLVKVAKDFPKLSFRLHYDEPGVGFSGIARTSGEGEIEDQVIEY